VGRRVLEVLCVMAMAILVGAMLVLAGCETPACTWHAVDQEEVNIRCRDYSGKTRGCQVSQRGECHLYVRD
jgi:hypothetical protein